MPAQRSHPRNYDQDAARAGVSTRIPLGVRPIRVKRIVGSAGKAEKLGPDFLPRGRGPARTNYQRIRRMMASGELFPPIAVYQLGNRYYVIDGHTRVAAAKDLGIDFLDADVTEALPRKEGEVNLTHYARREFERATGLEGIRLTAPWRYHLLQHHIEGYRLYLERSREQEVSLPEAARIWYRTQYLPTLLEIRRRNLTSTRGGRTAGDIYTDILRNWAEEEGLAVSLREMLDRYDQSLPRSTVQKAKRIVTKAVDSALPGALKPMVQVRPKKFEDQDVQAELAEEEEESGV